MFGLTFDKLVIIALLIGVLFGPERLPQATSWAAAKWRSLRTWVDTAQEQARNEFGPDVTAWTEHDVRKYDPRRIIRDALAEHETDAPASAPMGQPQPQLVRRRRSDGHWETITLESEDTVSGTRTVP